MIEEIGLVYGFHQGDAALIIGKSGSGKSVLAKCMVGLHVPEQGKVLYENRSFYDMDRDQKTEIRQEIGMLFQGSALFVKSAWEEASSKSVHVGQRLSIGLRMMSVSGL